jgi:hypothetical protein
MTNILTNKPTSNQLTPWHRVLLEQLTHAQLLKKKSLLLYNLKVGHYANQFYIPRIYINLPSIYFDVSSIWILFI